MPPVRREQAAGVEDEEHRRHDPHPAQVRGQRADREDEEQQQSRGCPQRGTEQHVDQTTESGSSFCPVGPIWISVPISGHMDTRIETSRTR